MAAWSGFTDDDLKKMRKTSHTDEAAAANKKANVRKQQPPQQQQQQQGKVMRSPRLNINTEATSERENVTDRMKLSAKSPHGGSGEENRQTAGSVTNSLHDSKVKETRRLHSSEAKSPTVEKIEDDKPDSMSPDQPSQSGSSDIKELDEHEAMSVELGNVQKFQQRQKVIEEANKRKRALLSKAIDDRRKKAKAEAEKLMKVQQELNHLDTLLTADITIIRDKIEEASLEYMEAQKRYEKAEKEFIAAKMDLFSKCETKEHLTEHLYTIIHQNEVRKAKKLVELMEKLAMEVTPEEIELTIQAIPQLTNFTAVSTLHDPHHVKVSSIVDSDRSKVASPPSIVEITRSENAQDINKDVQSTHTENVIDATRDAASSHSAALVGSNHVSSEVAFATTGHSSDSVSDVHNSEFVHKDSYSPQNGILQNHAASESNLNNSPDTPFEPTPTTSLEKDSTPQNYCHTSSNEDNVGTQIMESAGSADILQQLTDVQKNSPSLEPPALTTSALPISDHQKPEDKHSPSLSISSGKGWTLPFA